MLVSGFEKKTDLFKGRINHFSPLFFLQFLTLFLYSNSTSIQRKRRMEPEVPMLIEQRRSSITSNTDSCNSSESSHSPITTNYSSPLFPSPLPTYDKFTNDFELPFTFQSSFLHSPTCKSNEFDFSIKLPPIREPKRMKASTIEQDAVAAMIQLSTSHKKKLFI